MPWKVFEEAGKYKIHKMNPDGSKGEFVPPAEDSAEKAQARVRAMYANTPDAHGLVYDILVATTPGQPYRLLPFGEIKRANGGTPHNLTPELARRFKLPHFNPPIKLGSHADDTPAGGHIVGTEVREGENCPACISRTCKEHGLFVTPAMTEKGARAIDDGDYKYHSPEIIWPEGAIEDATTGQWINGPLIVGDALLHTPALGEATALYTSQIKTEGADMPEETVQVSKSFVEQLGAMLGIKPPRQADPAPAIAPEALTALTRERDDLAAKVAQIEADKLRAEVITRLTAELRGEKLGKEFDEKTAPEAAEVLSGMTDTQRDWVMTKLAAMSARINYSALTGTLGTESTTRTQDPRQAMNAAVEYKMKTAKVNYENALKMVKDEAPDLAEAYAATYARKPQPEGV